MLKPEMLAQRTSEVLVSNGCDVSTDSMNTDLLEQCTFHAVKREQESIANYDSKSCHGYQKVLINNYKKWLSQLIET